jgi:hypothetical protein
LRSISSRCPRGRLLLVGFRVPGLKTPAHELWGSSGPVPSGGRGHGGRPPAAGGRGGPFLAFPLVPVTHVLWRGDEEFDPEAGILFDVTIPGHLPTEDIAALAGASVYRLMAAARQMKGKK